MTSVMKKKNADLQALPDLLDSVSPVRRWVYCYHPQRHYCSYVGM